MIQQFRSREFLAFLVTGGIAAAVNFGSRIVYSHWMAFSPAIVLAYLTGMVTAFALARRFVFTSTRRSLRSAFAYFSLVNLVAVAQTWAISIGLDSHVFPSIGLTWHAQEVAHAIGIAVPVVTSYLGHKHLSFK